MMRRYRRYGRRKSTNVIRMRFQSFMDISTSSESMQIINISAGGHEIIRRLAPQFGAYKYYKIGKISIKLVPASTLPVDPTGLSYEVGENNTVDPRDQLTPGMMRITNGEDVFDSIAGLSDTEQHGIYNNMLLDPRWPKFMLQSGVRRSAYPRYWQIGQLHQDKWPGSILNVPITNPDGSINGTGKWALRRVASDADHSGTVGSGSSPYGIFQTGHKGVLGWLPTDGLQPIYGAGNNPTPKPLLASPPEIRCMTLLLPKAFKTRYYYRLFITEEVLFREPIVNFGIGYPNGADQIVYRPLDVFHYPGLIAPILPTDGIGESGEGYPNDNITGGNYGDD